MALAPIVLDSDPRLDDAVALQYLLGTGLWELKAYTAVGGNAPVEQAFRNAGGLARTISRVESFEVLPDSKEPEQTETAPATRVRLSREYEGELTVVATAPRDFSAYFTETLLCRPSL